MRLDITPAGSSGGGYTTVQDEGVPLTQRTTINFAGGGVTATDSGGVTLVTISGSASDPAIFVYNPGSFTVATGKYTVMSRHLILTGVQRATLQGTATLRIT